jgi:hypothetical protein
MKRANASIRPPLFALSSSALAWVILTAPAGATTPLPPIPDAIYSAEASVIVNGLPVEDGGPGSPTARVDRTDNGVLYNAAASVSGLGNSNTVNGAADRRSRRSGQRFRRRVGHSCLGPGLA